MKIEIKLIKNVKNYSLGGTNLENNNQVVFCLTPESQDEKLLIDCCSEKNKYYDDRDLVVFRNVTVLLKDDLEEFEKRSHMTKDEYDNYKKLKILDEETT